MGMTVENWDDSDTQEMAEWFAIEPSLCGIMGLKSRGDLELSILAQTVAELNGKAMMRAVRDGDDLIAYVCVSPMDGASGMAHITVSPWHRGRGLEAAKAALAHLKEDGRVKHLGATFHMDIPAKVQERFLRSCGFAVRMLGSLDL